MHASGRTLLEEISMNIGRLLFAAIGVLTGIAAILLIPTGRSTATTQDDSQAFLRQLRDRKIVQTYIWNIDSLRRFTAIVEEARCRPADMLKTVRLTITDDAGKELYQACHTQV